MSEFNKIRVGGQSADLEGYAYQVEQDSNGKPRGVLWYLSMVGHKGSVEAIWAALVNSPPQSCVLYYEVSEDVGRGQSADRGRAEARHSLAGSPSKSGWLAFFQNQA